MSGSDKKQKKHRSGLHGITLLNAAELALGVGAIFGFLAVLALLLMPWSLVLVATSIAVLALTTAVVLLTIPQNSLSEKLISTDGEQSLSSKREVTEERYHLTPSTQQIPGLPTPNKHKLSILLGS